MLVRSATFDCLTECRQFLISASAATKAGVTEAQLAEHAHWLAPHHYDPASRKIKLSVHSWLLQIDGKKILIDGCCGNQKSRPTRPFWNMLNTPYLDRLAAAGANRG